jgi:hypothetical protein
MEKYRKSYKEIGELVQNWLLRTCVVGAGKLHESVGCDRCLVPHALGWRC